MWLYHWGTQKADQKFTQNPIHVRSSDHYIDEYNFEFAERWDGLIDWDLRANRESQFISDILQDHSVRKVLDAAAGTGFDSIQLTSKGFDVVSLDGSFRMLEKAALNAKQMGARLKAVVCDWRKLTSKIDTRYDAIICAGNSFSHLFSEQEQFEVLSQFYRVLKNGGLLIVDHLNYDDLLENRTFSGHQFIYTGAGTRIQLDYLDEGLARFHYQFQSNMSAYLNLFPIQSQFFTHLVKRAGFRSCATYHDFTFQPQQQTPEFLIYAITK